MSHGSRLGWYARRLATMDPAEVAWRVRRLGQGLLAPAAERLAERRLPDDPAVWEARLDAFRSARDRPVLLDRGRAATVAGADPAAVAALVAAAERVVSGRVHYFGYPEAVVGPHVDWHHDPLTGYDWPRTPSTRLDHRTAPADPKWVWELNRLQHLPWLAQAWLVTGRDEFAEAAFDHLDTWIAQNPVGVGIAWRGAFEAGVRAVSVLVALQGLRDSPLLTVDRFRAVAEVMAASARACWRDRSLHSSANNHLIGELTGLATIGLLLPDLPGAATWVERAVGLLDHEADLQVLADGAGAEQAVGYQVFTAELLLVVLVLLRDAGRPEPRRLVGAVRRSARYLAGIVGDGDPAPRYGDDDEGFALRLGPEPVRTVEDHLGIVAAYDDGSAAAPGASGGLTARWVAVATGRAPHPTTGPTAPADPLPASFLAREGGLAVLRRAQERLTVDVGPLGYLSLAAHGHADALSLTWSVDGREVIGDPGTGSYYGHPAWRTAHRGTLVHATVAVDDEDQSVIAGPFLWTRHARVTLHEADPDRGLVDAEHDGYTRLEEPVVHRRRVELGAAGGFLAVDVVHGVGTHRVRVSWPLAPGLSGAPAPDGHHVHGDGGPVAQVATAATADLEHGSEVGDESTHRGWWSTRLEQREPSHLLRSTTETSLDEGPLVVATVARAHGPGLPPPVSGLAVRRTVAGAVVSWTEDGQRHEAHVPITITSGTRER